MKEMDNSWIKIYRSLLDWEWFADAEMLKLYIYLIIKANFKEGRFKGELVKRGQLLTGKKSLANDLGCAQTTTYDRLQKLKKTKYIDIKPTNKYTLITVLNYDMFQDKEDYRQQTDNKPTNDRQQTEPIEECKERKNVKKKEGAEIFFPFNGNEFKKMWQQWKHYKSSEHKFKYKSIQSEQAALKKLNELANHNEGVAIEIIMQSMANGWKGFFKLNQNKNGKSTYTQLREAGYDVSKL